MQPIINFEIAEMVRFYGTLMGTPGADDKVNEICNKNLEKLLTALQPDIDKFLAQKAGIITK